MQEFFGEIRAIRQEALRMCEGRHESGFDSGTGSALPDRWRTGHIGPARNRPLSNELIIHYRSTVGPRLAYRALPMRPCHPFQGGGGGRCGGRASRSVARRGISSRFLVEVPNFFRCPVLFCCIFPAGGWLHFAVNSFQPPK